MASRFAMGPEELAAAPGKGAPPPLPRLWFRGKGDVLLREEDGEPAVAPEAWSRAAAGRAEDVFTVRPQGVCAGRLVDKGEEAPEGCVWRTFRELLGSGSPWGALAGRALGVLNWRKEHRFCGRCGAAMAEHPVEVARQCPACGGMVWPDVSPAVIVRVEKEGKILLARHAYRNRDIFACIAGHVDAGETAEECVRREVREETGLEVEDIRYRGSQHWPFPNQLMLAFTSRWVSGEIRVQEEELLEAGWFDPARLPATPGKGSVAHRLIHGEF